MLFPVTCILGAIQTRQRKNKMKTTTKTIHGIKVTAYNDSNTEWVVQAGDMTEQRFDKKDWSMNDAMEFAARMAS